MNNGTEDLKKLLEIFENMSIEEYDKLYDELYDELDN